MYDQFINKMWACQNADVASRHTEKTEYRMQWSIRIVSNLPKVFQETQLF